MKERIDSNHNVIADDLRRVGAEFQSLASVSGEAKRRAAIANLVKANAANRERNATIVRAFMICATCGSRKFCKPREVTLKTYCSKACESKDYKDRMKGPGNPNFRNAGIRVCEQCGNQYKSHNRNRRFCTHACYHLKYKTNSDLRAARAFKLSASGKRPKKPRGHRIVMYPLCPICGVRRLPNGRKRTRTCGDRECIRKNYQAFWDSKPKTANIPSHICVQCKKEFKRYGKTQLFCSYSCFVANGGPFRAGLRASEMTRVYGAKKDANHHEIFLTIRELNIAVIDLSSNGGGVPDGAAWINNGWQLFEVKNPKTGYGKRGLNKIQKKWLGQFRQGGPVYIIRNVDQAIDFALGRLDKVESVTGDQCLRELLAG